MCNNLSKVHPATRRPRVQPRSNGWRCSIGVRTRWRARSYPIVNVANTVHLSKHHSYCLKNQNRGRKDRPLERHLIVDDHDKWITNTRTHQCAHYAMVPMNRVEGFAFFPAVHLIRGLLILRTPQLGQFSNKCELYCQDLHIKAALLDFQCNFFTCFIWNKNLFVSILFP